MAKKENSTNRKARDDRGNVTVFTALSIIPLLVAAGAAVDYSKAEVNQTSLQAALDGATLAAAKAYDTKADKAAAIKAGNLYFKANCTEEACDQISKLSFEVGNDLTVTGTSVSEVATSFMMLLGVNSMPVTALSQVRLQANFEHFYFAIDMSASMGIAADEANRQALEALTKPYWKDDPSSNMYRTPEGCTFACHYKVDWEPDGLTSYQFARQNGISLREDVLLKHVDLAIDTILDQASGIEEDQIKVAAYGFSETLFPLTGLTSDPVDTKAKVAAASVFRHGTRYDVVLPALTAQVGKSGTGRSESESRKTMILLTDGSYGEYPSSTQYKPLDTTYCDAIKANGVRLVVVNIRYVELTGNYWFEKQLRPHFDQLSTALKACASDGYYYEAEDSAEIAATLKEMTKNILNSKIYVSK